MFVIKRLVYRYECSCELISVWHVLKDSKKLSTALVSEYENRNNRVAIGCMTVENWVWAKIWLHSFSHSSTQPTHRKKTFLSPKKIPTPPHNLPSLQPPRFLLILPCTSAVNHVMPIVLSFCFHFCGTGLSRPLTPFGNHGLFPGLFPLPTSYLPSKALGRWHGFPVLRFQGDKWTAGGGAWGLHCFRRPGII